MAFKIKLKDLVEALEAVLEEKDDNYRYPRNALITCTYGGPEENPEYVARCIYGEALLKLGWEYDARIESASITTRFFPVDSVQVRLFEIEDEITDSMAESRIKTLIGDIQYNQDLGYRYGAEVKDAVLKLKTAIEELGL